MRCPRRDENPQSDIVYPGPDEWREDRSCSYCGGLDPALFLELAAAGHEVGPTDKNYKVYIEGSRTRMGKCYFQHFDDEQRRKLIELVNERRLTFQYPGHFYVLPFFMRESK